MGRGVGYTGYSRRVEYLHLMRDQSCPSISRDKDSLLAKLQSGRLLNLLLGPSVYFFAKFSFSKNLAKSI